MTPKYSIQSRLKHLLLCTFLLHTSISICAQSPKKLALIIAIGEYSEQSGWSNLGSENDAQLLREVLGRQGFEESNITTLQNKKATQKGIQKALEKFLLYPAREGDRVVFHFSGHGQQIADQNNDELDGYDEAIVPYDSPMRFEAGVYSGEKLIRDDELAIFFQKLRKKLGSSGQLLVLLDACHSGTATRGYATSRGSQYKMAPTEYLPSNSEGDERGFFQTNISHQEGNLAPMISISASSAQELNYEFTDKKGVSYGPLTYAFSAALEQIDALSNYRTLFDCIQQKMTSISPEQSPEIEGSLDLQVFNGSVIPTPSYSRVLRVYDSRTIVIDAGLLQGLHPGSRLAFYPSGTLDTTKVSPIVEGEIVNSLPLISEVILNKDLTKKDIQESWGILLQQNYGEIALRLQLDLADNHTEALFREALKEYEVIQMDATNPDLILEQSSNRNDFILKTRHGLEITNETTLGEASVDSLLKRMLAYTQASFLRQLNIEAEEFALNVELIPVTTKFENGTYQVNKQLNIQDFKKPHFTFREGNSFIIQIQNLGSNPAYFSLLDVQADHQLSIVLPNTECRLQTGDLYIEPGQTKKLDCIIDVYPPYGKDVLKLIATEKPLDLSRIIEKRGKEFGQMSPFEQLFQATFKDSDNKRSTPSIPPSSAHISTIVFEITP